VESWTGRIEKLLEGAPTRAAPFSRILQALAEDGVAVSGREDWILQRLAERGHQFKIIPDRLGPWLRWPSPARHQTPQRWRCESDPWIVAFHLPARTEDGQKGRFVGRIRECLLAWGRDVDEGSQVAVARWIGANGEAERALSHLLTLRGPPD
jgi:hypothetical protein